MTQNGKGDSIRKDLSLEKLRDGYDNISNFGYVPPWKKKLLTQEKKKRLKTSSEWLHSSEFKGTLIHNPTGWDRENWEEDFYKKKITKEQFVLKLASSHATISGSLASEIK
jgi:hypothetical protein